MTNPTRAERALSRLGRPIAFTLRTAQSEDDYGVVYAETEVTLQARVDYDSTATRDNSTRDSHAEYDATVYVSSRTDSLTGGGGESATSANLDGETYRVLTIADQDNGLYALYCMRES